MFCVVRERCINLTLGLLPTTHLTNGDQYLLKKKKKKEKLRHAVRKFVFLTLFVCFLPTVVAGVRGFYPRCDVE